MKRIFTTLAAIMVAQLTFAQEGTTPTDTLRSTRDTVKVGNFIIIRKKTYTADGKKDVTIERSTYNSGKPGRLSTNWFIFDLGFANVDDRTNYGSPEVAQYLLNKGHGTPTADDLKLKASKSSNVNIWVVMQKLNLAKGYINLKYGLGLEMFNLRYDSKVNYERESKPYIFLDSISFSKNKLYAGYATVPFMLNINTTPGRKGLSFSAGISAGYLIGSHDKQKSTERGKQKTKGDLGLEKFRLAYIGELGIGPVRLFGSYAITRLHEKALEQFPYSFGIRFSNW